MARTEKLTELMTVPGVSAIAWTQNLAKVMVATETVQSCSGENLAQVFRVERQNIRQSPNKVLFTQRGYM